MVKVHTRIKRKLSDGYLPNRKKGAKTFKTEEAANAYAKEQGYKKYKLEDLAANKESKNKIRIVLEE